jgi:hypothetical protein
MKHMLEVIHKDYLKQWLSYVPEQKCSKHNEKLAYTYNFKLESTAKLHFCYVCNKEQSVYRCSYDCGRCEECMYVEHVQHHNEPKHD